MRLAALPILALPALAQGWTTQEKAWEAGYVALALADWSQTRQIAKYGGKDLIGPHGERTRYSEINPLLGSHPSVRKVDTYFLLSTIGHVALSHQLSRGPRGTFQKVSVFLEGSIVFHNCNAGLRIQF